MKNTHNDFEHLLSKGVTLNGGEVRKTGIKYLDERGSAQI